jgi:hypothetical protein
MKNLFFFILLTFSFKGVSQSVLNFYVGGETNTYKLKNWSDPYLQLGLSLHQTTDSWFKEFRMGYTNAFERNGLSFAILGGKNLNNSLAIRFGAKMTGLTDDSPTFIHFLGSLSYPITNYLHLSIEYSYIPIEWNRHTFGLMAWTPLYKAN